MFPGNLRPPRHVIIPQPLTEEEWRARFRPIKNHFHPDNGFNSTLFGLSEVERAYITSTIAEGREDTIWTFLDDGSIVSGYHYVNRAGHFVCSVPVPAGQDFIVNEPEADEDDDEGSDACREDGCSNLVDLDGWDGRCGNCADAAADAEAEAAASDPGMEA